jgi:trans-aconitate methyltransferase
VVDVGCGTGAVIEALAEARPEARFEGWDPAPEAIDRARRRERPGLTFVLGDFAAADRRAELVLCLDVVEHVPDDQAFLEALAARAERLVLRVPLDLSVWDVARPLRLAAVRARYGHVHQFTRETAHALLDQAGLVVTRERYDRVPVSVDTWRRRAAEGARALAGRAAPDLAARWLGGFSWLVECRPAAAR